MKEDDLPSPPEWDLLLAASQKNNAREVRRLIQQEKVPPTHSNVVGQTALHIASLWGSVDALQVLIEQGANVNVQNKIAKMTPLHCAIRGTFQSFHETHSKRLQCVKLLLEAGADSKLCDQKGKDAFQCVQDMVQEAKLRGLGSIEAQARDMNEVLASGGGVKPKLLQYIQENNAIQVKQELSASDVSRIEINRAMSAVLDKIKTLIDEIDSEREEKSFTSVVDIVHSLLTAKIEDTNTDTCANPSLLDDCNSRKQEILHYVSSCIPLLYSSSSETAAFVLPYISIIAKDLLAHGTQINTEIKMLLPSAAHKGQIETVQFLIEVLGVDPNFPGRQGMTALHFAARSGRATVVKWLLDSCPKINTGIVDGAGKTAVDYASANSKIDIVDMLLQTENHE